jgi:hypothetical protein
LHPRSLISGSMLFAISLSTYNMVCKWTAWILIRLCRCAGWSGSMLVANPLCWFCHDAAHMIFVERYIWLMLLDKNVKTVILSLPRV